MNGYTRSALVCVLLVLTQACTSISYYSQVTRGHLDLMSRRVPIADVLNDPNADAALKARLNTVLEVREFAVNELALPDNKSYRTYADLERPFVLWNVFATDEFATEATTWCYLFVGCLGYRGYYSEDKANVVAAELIEQGYDAFVGGVPAYSTLGRFADPVLNTMLNRSDVSLAGLLFHELTHQVVYRNGDSVFSESLASFVQDEGVRRWLLAHNNADGIELYRLAQHRETRFVELVTQTRDALQAVYASSIDMDSKRAAKAREFEQLQGRYQVLRAEWGGYAGYDGWFNRELNNAHLASISTYNSLVPAFTEVMRESNGDFNVFFDRCAELAELDDTQLAIELEKRITKAD